MKRIVTAGLALALSLGSLVAAPFGHPEGPLPGNLDEAYARSRQQPYSVELLISFGTSSFGSAGHLAVAIAGRAEGGDDLVYSANFFADKAPEHEGNYTDDLMCRIPKKEYLWGTSSVLGPKAAFGLDFGECYKRSLVGIQIQGMPRSEVDRLVAYLDRLNQDYWDGAEDTEYHPGKIVYGYMTLNCAKTVASAFKYGLDWPVKIKGTSLISKLNPIKPTKANTPTDIAVKLCAIAARKGYGMQAVLYKKYASDYVDPHHPDEGAYKDLPNRFPSVFSLDYIEGSENYEDYDNLYAMHFFYRIGRCILSIDPVTKALRVEAEQAPSTYAKAREEAREAAYDDSKMLLRRLFRSWGVKIFSGSNDNSDLYHGLEKLDEVTPQGPLSGLK